MKFNEFLYSGFEFNKDELLLKFKFKMLNSVLLIVTIFGIFFGLLSDLGMNDLGDIQPKINYFYAFIAFLLIFFLRISKENYTKTVNILLVISLINFTFALILVPQDNIRFIWFYFAIYVSYILRGNIFGYIVTIASILIILTSNYLVDLQLENFSIYYIILGLIIASLLSQVYTNKITEYENELHNTLDILKEYTTKIEQLNDSLESRVNDEVEKNRINQEYMYIQSRMAQMGEMLAMIAHQWRQPLSTISSTSINLKMMLELDKFDLKSEDGINKAKDYFIKELDKVDGYIQNLSSTIDDFRNFYKPNKKSSTTRLKNIVEKSLKIIEQSIISKNIKLIQEHNSDKEIIVYENEIIQVLLNILKNAQDVLIEQNIQDPFIKIITDDKTISICDNAGGIADDIIAKIFDPYFSTKDEKNGTGLGLYMSKTIIEEHHHGKLYAKKRDNGVCFIIEL